MKFLRRNAQKVVIAVLTLAGLVWAYWGETPESVRARLDPDRLFERWAVLEFRTPEGRPDLHAGRNMRGSSHRTGRCFLLPPRHQVTFAGLRPGGRVNVERGTLLTW